MCTFQKQPSHRKRTNGLVSYSLSLQFPTRHGKQQQQQQQQWKLQLFCHFRISSISKLYHIYFSQTKYSIETNKWSSKLQLFLTVPNSARQAAAAVDAATFLPFWNKHHDRAMLYVHFRKNIFHRKEHIAHSKYTFFTLSIRHGRAAAAAKAAIFLHFSNRDCHQGMLYVRFTKTAFHRKEHIAHSKYNTFLTQFGMASSSSSRSCNLFAISPEDKQESRLYVHLGKALFHRQEHIAHSKCFISFLNLTR